MEIVNSGVLGIVFNFAPNYGVQTALVVSGAGASAGGTGLVFNYSANYGTQTGFLLR